MKSSVSLLAPLECSVLFLYWLHLDEETYYSFGLGIHLKTLTRTQISVLLLLRHSICLSTSEHPGECADGDVIL